MRTIRNIAAWLIAPFILALIFWVFKDIPETFENDQ